MPATCAVYLPSGSARTITLYSITHLTTAASFPTAPVHSPPSPRQRQARRSNHHVAARVALGVVTAGRFAGRDQGRGGRRGQRQPGVRQQQAAALVAGQVFQDDADFLVTLLA